MQITYPNSPKLGKFRILHEVRRDGRERPMLEALRALCTVLHEEQDETGRGVMYYCVSELFQPLACGDEVCSEDIPEYRIEYAWPDRGFTNPEHELDCIKGANGFRFRAVRKIIITAPAAAFRVQSGPNVH